MIDGRTVMELSGNRRSVEEIAGLWDYLAARLARCTRDDGASPGVDLPTQNRLLANYGGLAKETA
jgi:hypothetical protein